MRVTGDFGLDASGWARGARGSAPGGDYRRSSAWMEAARLEVVRSSALVGGILREGVSLVDSVRSAARIRLACAKSSAC